jgi:hypothetical protein
MRNARLELLHRGLSISGPCKPRPLLEYCHGTFVCEDIFPDAWFNHILGLPRVDRMVWHRLPDSQADYRAIIASLSPVCYLMAIWTGQWRRAPTGFIYLRPCSSLVPKLLFLYKRFCEHYGFPISTIIRFVSSLRDCFPHYHSFPFRRLLTSIENYAASAQLRSSYSAPCTQMRWTRYRDQRNDFPGIKSWLEFSLRTSS